jgi:hypothetical protein
MQSCCESQAHRPSLVSKIIVEGCSEHLHVVEEASE